MSFGRRLVAFFRFATLAAIRVTQLGGDLVFASSTPLTIALPALVGKWLRQMPMVLEVRDLWPEVPIAIGALKSPLSIRAARLLEAVAYRQSKAVIALSPLMRSGVIAGGADPQAVALVPNSCDFELFDVPKSKVTALRGRYEWLGDRPLILYAGTLGKLNGVGWLVELAQEMDTIEPTVRFAIVGQGMEKDFVEASARDAGVLDRNLFMLDACPKREVASWFGAADLVCSLFIDLPELHANSANKFFDALASGTALLLNHAGWHRDLVEERGIGLALDRHDKRRAADQVARLLRDREKLRIMGNKARAVGRELYDRDLLAQHLLDVLERAARRA